MTDIADDDAETLVVPMEMVEALFEPWDDLDAAITRLEAETRSFAGVPEIVATIMAAREALRSPLYVLLSGYQAVVREAEAEAEVGS